MTVRDEPVPADWHGSQRLPDAFAAFDVDVLGAPGVGEPGKQGVLEMEFAPTGGVTRVHRHYQHGSLYTYRPTYLDPYLPDMAFVFLQQSGDGLVQGDRLHLAVTCRPGAAVHLTTQTPTKVFRARQNYVAQLVDLDVGEGAVLEYLPDPVVPFRGSRLFQRTSLRLHETATALVSETLLPGRVAHGEAHVYDVFWSETEVCRVDGTMLVADMQRLGSAVGVDPKSSVLLGDHEVLSTMYVFAQGGGGGLIDAIRIAIENCTHVIGGVTELPNECGIGVRILAATSLDAQRALRAAWNAARVLALGAPAPDLRKG